MVGVCWRLGKVKLWVRCGGDGGVVVGMRFDLFAIYVYSSLSPAFTTDTDPHTPTWARRTAIAHSKLYMRAHFQIFPLVYY